MQCKLFDALSLIEKKKLQHWINEKGYTKDSITIEFTNGDAIAKFQISEHRTDTKNLSFGILKN